LASIAAAAKATVLIRGTIAANATGSIANTATVTTPTPWLDGTNPPVNVNAPPVSITPTPTADIGITVDVDNPNPKPGDILTHTINVRNNGPDAAQNTEVGFTPPANYTNIEFSTDGGRTWTPWVTTATIPSLPNGETAKILLRGKINGNQPNITATFTAKTKEQDPNPADNTFTAVTPVNQLSNVVIAIKADKDCLYPGDTVTYTVTMQNYGPATAKTPSLSYHPPAGLMNVEFSKDNGITWAPWTGNTTLADIPNNGTQQVLIRGRIDSSLTGIITSTVTVTTQNDHPASSDRTAASQINIATRKIYTVTYYSNNRIRESQKVPGGTPAPMPTDPTRSNMSFLGWFTAQRGKSVMWDFSQPVTSNMTLYAKWIMQR
jgi:uncharacterized repeat protein (TIGR01451 family)/uncharacterized repeat protein (TIGR02543 family)